MAYQAKPNTGSLFKNEKKEKDTHADYRGDAEINGESFYVDAWINEIKQGPKAGRKYLSLKFKPKQARQPQQQRGRQEYDNSEF